MVSTNLLPPRAPKQDSSAALPLQHKISTKVVESPSHKKVHDRERTDRPPRPPQQRELPICRSSLQPQSLSGKKLDPNDIPMLDGSQQHDVAICSYNTRLVPLSRAQTHAYLQLRATMPWRTSRNRARICRCQWSKRDNWEHFSHIC